MDNKNKVFSFSNSLIAIFLLLGIIIFINIFFSKLFIRLDLTKNKRYSITEGTKKVLGNLPSNVIIKGYFSKNMPPEYSENINYTKDILREFSGYSKGKIKLDFIDPEELDESKKRELLYSGIKPIQVEILKNDKYELVKGYMGVVIYYLDKQEVIPVLSDIRNLEYDIITRINKLTREKKQSVGILSFTEDSIESIKTVLGEKYEILDLVESDGKFDKQTDLLLVIGGTKEIIDNQILAIDQYVLSNKPVLFFVDTQNVDLSTMQKQNINEKLIKYINNLGIKFTDQLIYDNQNVPIRVQRKEGIFTIQNIVNFPYIPMINAFNKENPVVSSLTKASGAFFNGIDFDVRDDVKFDWLMKSSNFSYAYTEENIMPGEKIDIPDSAKKGPFILGGVLSGKFNSYFKDKKLEIENFELKNEGLNNKIILFSDSDMIKDQFLDKENNILIQNCFDWSLQNGSLINIRSKNVSTSTLKELKPLSKKMVKYINIFLVPILIMIIGLLITLLRKSKEGKVYV